MNKRFGITYELSVEWVSEFMDSFKIKDKWDDVYLFEDGDFYYFDEDVNDDQESNWKKVEDIYLIEELTEELLNDKRVVDEFYKYIETEITHKVEQDYIMNLIERI